MAFYNLRRFRCVLFVAVLFFIPRFAFCGCSREFLDKVSNLKWIAYAPTNFDPQKKIFPSIDSIKKDLETLREYGFNGLVTYGSDDSLGYIPEIAKEVGFSGVIMGIWIIDSPQEIANAIDSKEYVDGYCIGNEGLDVRYDIESLRAAISSLKKLTNKPVATTEQINYYAKADVYELGDWIFPNIHPFLNSVRDPAKAAQWIKGHYWILKKHCPLDRAVLFKEVGFPTSGGNSASTSNQMKFFIAMQKLNIPFVYFEAFDQPWKRYLPVEPYWGLFKPNRKPKKYAATLNKEQNAGAHEMVSSEKEKSPNKS